MDKFKLYDAPGIYQSWYDSKIGAFIMKVQDLNLGVHRQLGFDIHIPAMKKYKPDALILDAGEAIGHHQPGDMQWLINVGLPAYKENNIQTIIFIFPKNVIAKLAANSWLQHAATFGFTFIECVSLEEAISFLQSKKT